MFEPAIKWSGSKRSHASEIVNRIPREIGTYYEPFCGGCSVLRRLLSSKEHRVNSFVCSDANSDLIDLWNAIRDSPEFIVQEYTQMWNELNKDNDLERKKVYFNHVRGGSTKQGLHKTFCSSCVQPRMGCQGTTRTGSSTTVSMLREMELNQKG